MKYMKEFRGHFSKKAVFSVRDVWNHFARQKISRRYVWQMLKNLLKNGEIFRIAKGLYSFRAEPNLVAFAIRPSYFGLQDALSIRGLWGQQVNPILITPRKVRSGLRDVLGAKVIVRRISRDMFFGFEMVNYAGLWVPVSDAEKTLIDFCHFNQPLDRQALKKIIKKTDRKKLAAYLKKAPRRTRAGVERLISAKNNC